ncbi:DedA family protein [Enterobacillus tribolii]|uniref:Membrane protein DedA with SNARE-associated domain n=1 Tax=Enterobacillus tribolii TaxID=1487935 RepID=A0A370R2T1_9GAMM|nr:DedA family protein [Enterobacillus tribolii]MBW7984750.1 DedA family protein [Enterobacillus tribolii]RDK96751.1 membrane protein DedA with SNARE-associated domain [Enterobacillus tribolii]
MTEAGQWIADYGYIAVVVGSILEGETIAFLAGAAAHKHILSYPLVLLLTMAGACIGDMGLYFIGRRFGSRILQRFRRQQARIAQFRQKVHAHETLLILGMRFAYGFRTIGPIVIGSAGVRPGKFILLNLIGAVVWAFCIVTLGYGATELLHRLFADQHQRRIAFLILAICLLLLLIGVKLFKQRHKHDA